LNEPFFFIHIPKTAGTSWRSVLYRQYEDGEVCAIYDGSDYHYSLADVAAMQRQRIQRFRAFIGHLRYGTHRSIPGLQVVAYGVFLREPVARAISHYRHFLAHQYQGSGYTIADFIEQQNPQFDNLQTRLVAGEHRAFGKCDPALLERAVQNLSTFRFVGLTEEFETSLFLAIKALGWRPLNVPHLNVARDGSPFEVTAETVDLIRRYNALDLELYAHGRRLFQERLGGLGEGWEEEFAAFRAAIIDAADATGPVSAIGSLGELSADQIRGWARLKNSDEVARIRVVVNGGRHYVVTADRDRPDLRQKQLHPTGRCGFLLRLPSGEHLVPGDRVSASVLGGVDELSNSPRTFGDVAGEPQAASASPTAPG
jgi:hypothetical protein